ncbi:Peroxisome biogenesis protein 6 [Apostasia shenzhenica]|uniref:Peroxisomal ATPase PEX6 n=1 Tax=Apostasia shenzhenica TaxID=1088818 RepID=A0A2I0B8D6_9ASPA|nr:Peroxisome biogenesis protein 6 [Apostasia shenzhenica]
MVERRKPLVLSSTRKLLDSVLKSAKSSAGEYDARESVRSHPSLRLRAGILRFSCDSSGTELQESSHLVGVSSSVLKRLSVTSGSLVLIKNADNKVGRLVKVLALDGLVFDATRGGHGSPLNRSLCLHRVMNILPSLEYNSNPNLPYDLEVAFVTPLLAFNLGLHVSSLKVLLHEGQGSINSLFEVDKEATVKEDKENAAVNVELVSWTNLPRYASHVRISYVKMPECGMLVSLRGNSKIDAEDRQDMIDSALNDYFKLDRYLTKGDVFCVQINWSCHSELCISCNKGPLKQSNNFIYFKVGALEPSDEPTLRVNRDHTALVLGGSVASTIPPDFFTRTFGDFMPLQGDTVKILASIFAPTLCPSVLSSKFKVSVFIHGPQGCGKRTVVHYLARCFGIHVVEYNCHDFTSSERKAASALANAFETALRYSPSILLLRRFDAFGNLSANDGSVLDQVGITSEVASVIRDFTEPLSEDEQSHSLQINVDGSHLVEPKSVSRHRVLFVATANSSEGLKPPIRRCFSHEISINSLTEVQRLKLLSQLLEGVNVSNSQHIDEEYLKDITAQTSGFMPRDLNALVADAGAHFVHKFLNDNPKDGKKYHDDSATSFPFTKNHGSNFSKEDFNVALEHSKKRNASALGTPKVPNIKWEDVGGLEEVKKSILDTVQLPLLHKDLFSSGLRKRSGVLLYGPPGTGKTLLAKAVATECSLNFLSVKGPELINMYIGESEKNVRDIFQKARSARPCVIFFDELDSLAPARGASGDSGGVMDRVVSQMLAEIDGLSESSQDLFVIGASNRPDLIDPALLRPGRFDKLLYVGVNSDASYRERVLVALTRKFRLHDSISLLSVAKRCPQNFTGADMYALCADAWFHAAKRKVSVNHEEPGAESDSVIVEMDDFMKVLGELSPSLSMAELKKYEQLRDQFEGSLR